MRRSPITCQRRAPVRTRWARLAVILAAGALAVLAAAQYGRSLGEVSVPPAGSVARARQRPLTRSLVPLPNACRQVGVPHPPPHPRAVIRKAERVLALYSGESLVKEYDVGLGKPDGDKQREGDRKTPEGTFYVCTRLERSRFHRFLGISYPAPEDAERGLRAGIISTAEHAAILQAHQRRRRPPWDTPLGGAVGIHGGGGGYDWTLGCIAVDNGAVEELFGVLRLGTPVEIRR